jgi:hypothetical protein
MTETMTLYQTCEKCKTEYHGPIGKCPKCDSPRPLSEIAREIRKNWSPVYFGAVPYLDAMSTLNSISEDYFCDSAVSIVLYFLANAQTWRGPVARRIKAELKAMAKVKR